jgi:SAM-dependent methyltransferase
VSAEGNRWLAHRQTSPLSPADYDAAYDRRAAAGENVHGEADLVVTFAPRTVLDAGCGTGRVGRELARRGLTVTGVDIDAEMLAVAREKGPGSRWEVGDLATVDLGTTFDAIVMAGNVMIFLAPGSEGAVVANMARHLAPGGVLIAGFQLQPGRLAIARYDAVATAAGLVAAERWSTWQQGAWHAASDYVVAVHRRPPA